MPPGAVFWITGLPGSGKSSLAQAAKEAIPSLVVLRMDEMRKVVTPDPSYSEQERDLLYMALVFTAMSLSRAGLDVVVDATANMRRWRDAARARIPRFHEVYVSCPLPVCREREALRLETHDAPRDVYKKGRQGWPVPGVNVPYEEPEAPELVIDNGTLPLADAAAILVEYIKGEV